MSATSTPFVATTTPTIERANRLISVRSNPGFLDILRLSQEMVDDAVQVCINYGGWDPQQIVVLKIRMQAAQEHHTALIAKIQNAIQEGIAEYSALNKAASTQSNAVPEKTPAEVIEQGDFVRQEVLTKFTDMDNRIPGSY